MMPVHKLTVVFTYTHQKNVTAYQNPKAVKVSTRKILIPPVTPTANPFLDPKFLAASNLAAYLSKIHHVYVYTTKSPVYYFFPHHNYVCICSNDNSETVSCGKLELERSHCTLACPSKHKEWRRLHRGTKTAAADFR